MPLYVPRKWIERYKETVHFRNSPKKFVLQLQTVWSSPADHHWKLLKTLDLNTYQGFLFLFFKQLFLVISMNISKIKHHSYETLNLQVCLIILVLTHENLWFWAIFCKEKVIFITGMSFFLFLTHGNEFLSMFWTINACRIHN